MDQPAWMSEYISPFQIVNDVFFSLIKKCTAKLKLFGQTQNHQWLTPKTVPKRKCGYHNTINAMWNTEKTRKRLGWIPIKQVPDKLQYSAPCTHYSRNLIQCCTPHSFHNSGNKFPLWILLATKNFKISFLIVKYVCEHL